MSRPTPTRRLGVAAAAALLMGSVPACGSADTFAGIQPAPTEVTTTAPIPTDNATRIAARVLADAAKARAATGDEAEVLRKAVFTGPALAMANAAARAASGTPDDAVSRPGEPEVVAISRGTGWPRYLVVTTAEESVQQLHLLVAPDARTPYRVAATATVRSGTAAFEELQDGAQVVSDGSGLTAKPQDLLGQYAAALAYPKPAAVKAVTVADPFAAQVRANAATQAKSLGALATVGEKHVVDPKQTVALTLKDGGALVFGLLTRTDTVTKTDKAQSLTYRTPSGVKTLKKGATLVAYETVVLTVPASGAASLIAADEQLISTSAS